MSRCHLFDAYVAVLYVFLKTGSEPATLIGCWFGTFLTELWAISKIKRDKIKHNGGENNDAKTDK